AAPTSTVSIGSVGKERTLTNLAAGRLSATSTDAVNGSQLYATNQAIEGISGDISDLSDLAVKYDTNPDGTINYNRVSMGGTTYNSTTKAGGTTLTNVAYGVNDSDAVNVQQLRDATSDMYNNGVKYFHANSTKADSVATGTDSIAVGPAAKSVGESSIAMGNAATSTGAGSMAMGQNARSTGENSVAIGAGAVANNKGDVALGAGATTEQAVGTQGVTIRGNDYQFAGTTPTGTVSVGSLDNERTITNVAAGRISATSTDAVNGSQLYATNQAIEAINTNFSGLDNSVVKYVVNGDGSIDYSKIALAGDTYDQSTKTGGTTITNVAAGVNASDAVNKQQLDEVSLNVTNIAEGKDGMFQVNNTSNLPKPKPTGQNSIAGGAGAVASATNSMALGNSAKATHSNAVALGTNSVTDRDNSVSMGYAGGERQITHVAAGTAATDAVNVGQLKQSMGDSYTYTNNKFGELKEMIADQDDKLSAGIAGAMAMASLPQPYSPGASMFSMAGGTYQGESAIAMGVSTVSDNGKWVTKLSGSSNSQGDLGGSVGIGYQW
ncbi:YadA-like family protein, partial [Leclercia pneumoniae]